MGKLVNTRIWVPFDLALNHPEIYRGTMVYMAIASKTKKGKVGVMSLEDIIYLIGMKPKAGTDGTNYKIAQTINQLRELGYLEMAPDYFADGMRMKPKQNRGFKIPERPKKSKDYAMVYQKAVRDFCNLARTAYYRVEGEEKDKQIRFSTDNAVHVYFFIRQRIFREKSNVAVIRRSAISEAVGIAACTVTEITTYLDTMNFIKKRNVFRKDGPDDAVRETTFYTICSKDEKETQERLDLATKNYWKQILDKRDKSAGIGTKSGTSSVSGGSSDDSEWWGEKSKSWAELESA